MLKEEQFQQILKELDECKRPLYFFHDDSDGLCSFLLMYRHKREGKGVCVKAQPRIDERFYKVVREYMPDKIFVLDIAMVSQDFVDEFRKIPIVWVDHHKPTETKGTKYFNPMINDEGDNTCVSELCYKTVKNPDDLWIAVAGIVGDWQLSEVTKEFAEKNPGLLSPDIDRPEKALFDSGYSRLVRIMNFILKGPTQEVNKCVKIMTRIESPKELLDGETPRARFILKRFKKIDRLYEELIRFAMKNVGKGNLLVVKYQENKMSFSGELANDLLFRYPEKVIIVGRVKSGEVKCSLRSSGKIKLPKILEEVFEKVQGYGGGHEHACGAVIPEEEFERFVEEIRKRITL